LKSVSAQVQQLTTERDAAQSKLEATDAELAKAKEATQQANAKASELENAANQAKDAEAQRAQIQSALDEANKELCNQAQSENCYKTRQGQQQSANPARSDRARGKKVRMRSGHAICFRS
jgi:chromosome segregation ATPase